MENMALKIRIAVLWIFMAVGMSAAMLLALMMPGVIDDIRSGEMEGMEINEGMTALFAIFWLIPLTMAFLTVTLKGSANRWTNIIVGIILAAFYIFDVSGHLSRGELGGHLLMAVSVIVAAALIVWYAYKWPKK